MLKAFSDKFTNEEIECQKETRQKYLSYKELLLKQFEKQIQL